MTGLGKYHDNPSIYNEPDCVDVQFDHDGYISQSKFTWGSNKSRNSIFSIYSRSSKTFYSRIHYFC